MGFNEAVNAHAAGHIQEACRLYEEALRDGCKEPPLFQNLGALYRQDGEIDKAKELYEQGLALYPGNTGILANRVNILKHDEPIQAISDLLLILRQEPEQIESWLNLLFILYEQGCFDWSVKLLHEALRIHPKEPRLWYRALAVSLAMSEYRKGHEKREKSLLAKIDELARELDDDQKSDLMVIMAGYGQIRRDDNIAERYYRELLVSLSRTSAKSLSSERERKKNYHIASWNYSAFLLRQQNFELGWDLFDHGLQAPCDTNPMQVWQRALVKPFSTDEVPLWNGEPLQGKRLLVLAEQGIGDTMMFATLLPVLEEEALSVCLFTSERLCKGYKIRYRGATEFMEVADMGRGRLKAENYDYQIPIGSICRFRFRHPGLYAPLTPVLKASQRNNKEIFRGKYGVSQNECLVGISWAGGGGNARKREKSIGVEQLVKILARKPGLRYVSLQYGETRKMQEMLSSHGIELIIDQNIDAIHGFPDWLDQVAACDSVISVANTTIHAAGAFGIPTMCLLGDRTDWRWLNERSIRRSYWYKSVRIARQAANGSWSEAIAIVEDWMNQGFPLETNGAF